MCYSEGVEPLCFAMLDSVMVVKWFCEQHNGSFGVLYLGGFVDWFVVLAHAILFSTEPELGFTFNANIPFYSLNREDCAFQWI